VSGMVKTNEGHVFVLAQKWHTYILAVGLSPLLTGKGFDVYTNMHTLQANAELKKARLKRYRLKEDGFYCVYVTLSQTGDIPCFSLFLTRG
jgi:hypothetical protein